jgi:hypothetical protein
MPNAQQNNNPVQQALIDHVTNAVGSSRATTKWQLVFACILMLAGAGVGVVSVELKQTAVVAGFGTALIGAGATLLPAGASASANAELHSALAQLAILAAPPQPLTNISPTAPADSTPVTPAPATANASSAEQAQSAALAEQARIAAANGSPPEAAVRSAVEADAADAAALLAEQPT